MRTLGSTHPADHLDSTHTCLNNPENHKKTSRMDSLEPSIDERPRKRVGRVERHYMDWQERAGAVEEQPTWQGRAPEFGLQKQRGQMECLLTASGT